MISLIGSPLIAEDRGQEYLPGENYQDDVAVLNNEIRKLRVGVTEQFVVMLDGGDTATLTVENGRITLSE